jgi:hypothetical protein
MSKEEEFNPLSICIHIFALVQSKFDPAIGLFQDCSVFLSNPTFRMQAIRRLVPRARTLSHGPQVARRLSIPAHSLLQQRLYTNDMPRAFPYWSRALLKEEHLRTLPYKERLNYISAKSATVDVAPSPRILIRGLQPSIKFSDIETSSLLSGNVGISGSA